MNLFELFVGSEKLYNQTVSPVCEKYSLTHMEFTVLMFLANNPKYDTATEIVKYRHLTKSHVSVSIHTLEEKGLLTGRYKDQNNKTVHLEILSRAARIVEDGKAAQQEYKRILTEGLTEEENEVWMKAIATIDQNINKYLEP